MKTLRMHLLGLAAAGTLLGLGLSVITAHSNVTPAGAQSVAMVACTPAVGNWTDCSLTLDQGVGPGGQVTASLPSGNDMGGFCNSGSPLDALCAVSGNSAVFTCPEGCPAGTVFSGSVLGATVSADNLAQLVTVTVTRSASTGSSS